MTETRKGSFTSIGETLTELLAQSGMAERLVEAAVVPEWAERVGPAIAAVTRPVSAARGVLTVAVRSSAWLMELNLMEREILQRLNADRESGRIRRIRFIMDGEEPPGQGRR